MKRTTYAIMACIFAAVIAFSGCAPKPESGIVTIKLSEVTHSIFYAPLYAAMDLGYFEDEGLKLELTNAGGADKVMTAVMSGDADIGLAGPEQTVYVLNQGQENGPINFAQMTQCDGSFIIAREYTDSFDISDFIGKHILGGRKGGMPVMALEYTLRRHGITPGEDCDVDTSIAFDALPGAFISGVGDYVSLFEPTASKLASEGHGFIVQSLGELSGKIPYTVYNAKKDYIENNTDTVRKFVSAVKRGQEYVQSHTPEEIAKAIAPYFPDDSVDHIASIVAQYKKIDAYASSPLISKESYELLLDILDSSGELTARPPYEALVLTDFMK
ncbi:MAG: ABC transporter substrate-binding protein [Eubacteriaceae bacterium]|nr:ABC transporter substrate-binding protein [Eubacteriaceae bacterium]